VAHFAEVDPATNLVVNVLVLSNDVTHVDGVEDEQRGIDFLNDLYPESGTWVQTSYNTLGGVHYEEGGPITPDDGTPLRYNYASIGDTWDEANGAFVKPQLFPSWALSSNFEWEPPTPRPEVPMTVEHEGVTYHGFVHYYWDEDTTSWVEAG
tara:strand:+ start:102 stop:557 length:456 start_codon:yes stop_codon:yes gene_type:complete